MSSQTEKKLESLRHYKL